MDDGAWEIQPALTPPSITISSTLFLVWITDINEKTAWNLVSGSIGSWYIHFLLIIDII